MKIEFKKISKDPKEFDLQVDGVHLVGSLRHKEGCLYEFRARLSGTLPLVCDRTGEECYQDIQEELFYLLCDGIYTSSEDAIEVVEFFDGFVDIAFLLESEVESIKLEYHTFVD